MLALTMKLTLMLTLVSTFDLWCGRSVVDDVAAYEDDVGLSQSDAGKRRHPSLRRAALSDRRGAPASLVCKR